MSSQRGIRTGRRTISVLIAIITAIALAQLAVRQAAGSEEPEPAVGPGAVLVEDTYVKEQAPTATRGSQDYLRVGDGDVAYLKFRVSSLPSNAHAVLWLRSDTDSRSQIAAYAAATSEWAADDLDWKNQPGSTGSPLRTFTGTTDDGWVPVDLSDLITAPGTYSIVLKGLNDDRARFGSQESSAAPRLDLSNATTSTAPAGSATASPTAPAAGSTASPSPARTISPSAAPLTAQAISTAQSPVPTPTTGTSVSTSKPDGEKVLVIVDENHTQAQAQAGMPYLVSLQDTFGVTTHHTAPTHPSLPNYLVIAGGSTFAVADDAEPSSHPVAGESVFGAALAQGRSARTYNESMSTPCQQASSGDYAVKHNPWAYFVDERTECQANDVPLNNLPGDIGAGNLPDVGMITPNMCNDGHDCSLGAADAFLSNWVPQIMDGPDYRSGHLTIVVTFDEGVGSDQIIQTVVVNPAIHATVVTAALTHSGLSRWLYRVSGSTPRNDAATAADFGAAFGL